MQRISFTIPDELVEPFKTHCDKQGRSVSGFITFLIRMELSQRNSQDQLKEQYTNDLVEALAQLFGSDWEYTQSRLKDGRDYSGFLDFTNIWRWQVRDTIAEAYTKLSQLMNQ